MTSPRRIGSFSLRTMFVGVALAAIPLGWYASMHRWMDDRDRAFGEMVGDRPLLRDPDWFHGAYSGPPPPALRFWGCYGYTDIWIHGDRYGAELDRVHRLFPEAKLHRDKGDNR